MTEKKGRAVEKRNQYDIGNEAGISYMNKGLQGLLAQMKHLFPFGKKGIPALNHTPAIPVEIQPGMNNPFRSFSLSWTKGKKHDLVCRIGGQA